MQFVVTKYQVRNAKHFHFEHKLDSSQEPNIILLQAKLSNHLVYSEHSSKHGEPGRTLGMLTRCPGLGSVDWDQGIMLSMVSTHSSFVRERLSRQLTLAQLARHSEAPTESIMQVSDHQSDVQ